MKIGRAILWDLDLRERVAVRRQYRTLRIAIYAPQSSEHATNGMLQGFYGMTRHEAKVFLMKFYVEIAAHRYLGSK